MERKNGQLKIDDNIYYIDITNTDICETVSIIEDRINDLSHKSLLISVVIVSFDRNSQLELCVKNLLNQRFEYGKYEIVIVTDKNKKFLESKNIKVICRGDIRNIGLGTARNIGIKNSMGKIVVLLDSDIIVNYDFLSNHYYYHKRNSSSVVLGARFNVQSESMNFNNVKKISKFTY